MHIYKSILDTAGDTPLVKINRLSTVAGVSVLAKLEGKNPSGSVKDRIALEMLRSGEAEGLLRPGMTVIEATSGNTGISLAMACAVTGYPLEIAMSEAASVERRGMLEAYGARVTLTPAALGTDGAAREVERRISENPGFYFHPDQFANRANPLAHYSSTAAEILRDTDGRVTHFVAATGSSGTLMGVAARLREFSAGIRIIAAVPEKRHRIQGLRNFSETAVPAIYDPSLLDAELIVSTEEAFETTRALAREEGIFAGMSSGAAMAAATRTALRAPRGSMIVVLFADRGEKYLSTGVFKNIERGGEYRAAAGK